MICESTQTKDDEWKFPISMTVDILIIIMRMIRIVIPMATVKMFGLVEMKMMIFQQGSPNKFKLQLISNCL